MCSDEMTCKLWSGTECDVMWWYVLVWYKMCSDVMTCKLWFGTECDVMIYISMVQNVVWCGDKFWSGTKMWCDMVIYTGVAGAECVVVWCRMWCDVVTSFAVVQNLTWCGRCFRFVVVLLTQFLIQLCVKYDVWLKSRKHDCRWCHFVPSGVSDATKQGRNLSGNNWRICCCRRCSSAVYV